MIKHISPQELLTSEQFVREPVDALGKKISESSSKKIILNGGRGTGKSILLHTVESKGIGTETQTIFTRFDSSIVLSVKPDMVFDEKFLKHYYELTLTWKLLTYIKKYYNFTYEKYFKDFELLLQNISKNTDNYIHNAYWERVSLDRYLLPTELSSQILHRLKDCLDIHSFTLAIDRFDWNNGNSGLDQQILSDFFDMFEKTIITTDDETLEDINNRKSLEEKGFAFTSVDYGHSKEIIKHIVDKRIEFYNRNVNDSYAKFDKNIITDEIYQALIDMTGGNISLILDSVGEAIDMWRWKKSFFNLNEQFNIATNNQINTAKKLRKMGKLPKLHL